LRANDTTLVLKHYSPAHTDSDISVLFEEADILHVGDTFWNRDYPFIDYSTEAVSTVRFVRRKQIWQRLARRRSLLVGTEPWAQG